MERFFYSEGYNRALDDVIVLIKTSSDISSFEDLVDRLEKCKIRCFTEVELWIQNTLAKMFGGSQGVVSRRLRTYLKHYNKSNSFMQKRLKHCIKLKTKNTTQLMKFYNFKAVSYLAHTIKSPEAFDMF